VLLLQEVIKEKRQFNSNISFYKPSIIKNKADDP
jgi:hypothetical protein